MDLNKKSKIIHLSNAPITEALIDIRIQSETQINDNQFSKLFNTIKSEYPTKQNKVEAGIKFDQKEGSVKTLLPKVTGYFYKNSDENQIVQFRQNGFTFSRLSPYTVWEELKAEGEKLWNIYKKHTKPNSITRIALRFINRLNYKLPLVFNEYLTSPPVIPVGFSNQVYDFFTRVTFMDEDSDNNAILSQALEFDKNKKTASIILDIDAFRMKNYDPDDNSIWAHFEALRIFKNDIFFSSVTDKGLEKYK